MQFKNDKQIVNKYDAAGQKLRTDYFTRLTALSVPLTAGQVITQTHDGTTVDQRGTAYVGNMEYTTAKGIAANTKLDKIMNAEGYVTTLAKPEYFYFRRDHLGTNREVWTFSSSGDELQQVTQYYPSGLPWSEGRMPETQNRKYNGKEFVEAHGYDTYDYGARGYYPAIMRFTTSDPMAEKYYSVSPYAYCAGNPVNRIDPDGMDWVYRLAKGVVEAYYDRDVSSQNDVISKYGKDGGVVYMGNGSTLTSYDKNGKVTSRYTFSNDAKENKYGTVTDMNGNVMDKGQIIYGEKYTIFGTSDNSVNAETLHNNYFGTSYIGPDNPKDYNGNDSYQYMPRNLSEYPAYFHDQDYDKLNARGRSDAIANIWTYQADRDLAERSKAAIFYNNNNLDRLRAAAVYGVFNLIANYKTPLAKIQMRIGLVTSKSIYLPMPYSPF